MPKIIPAIVFVFLLTMNASAQIQKTPHNRVFVDEDYEYTETARRMRNLKAQMEKGMGFYKANDFRAAADAFSLAISLDPSVFAAQHNLGVAHLHLGDFKAAVKDFRTALDLDRSSASSWHFLGFALYNLKENVEAASCYEHSLDLDSRSVVTWNNLGATYLDMGKFEPAGEAFNRALAIETDSLASLNGLCVAYARLKQSDEAVAMCNKARAAKDSYSSTYYLAWSYLDLKKYPEAIAVLKDCARLGSQSGRDNAPTYIALAEAHFRLKHFKEALGYAQQAVEVRPDAQNAYVAMGSIYFEMKKLKDAKRIFEKALSLPPESASARYNLAMTCLAMKQKDCAREQYAILKTSEPVLSTRLLDQIYSSKVITLVK